MASGKAGLWFGDIDDLWKLGRPQGVGGPWKKTLIKADTPSDPYLMTGYDRKRVELSHDMPEPVVFTIEVDALADGTWQRYESVAVEPGRVLTYEFPAGYSARWVRLLTDKPCTTTAVFTYL